MPQKPCKDCVAEGVMTKRDAPHPGPRCATHHRAVRAERKQRNRERRVESVYGLTPAGLKRLLEIQGGLCFICRRANGARKALAIDHDHRTGAVRGALCGPCNKGLLGHVRDDVATLARAIEYLLNPPARLLDPAVHLVPKEEVDEQR